MGPVIEILLALMQLGILESGLECNIMFPKCPTFFWDCHGIRQFYDDNTAFLQDCLLLLTR